MKQTLIRLLQELGLMARADTLSPILAFIRRNSSVHTFIDSDSVVIDSPFTDAKGLTYLHRDHVTTLRQACEILGFTNSPEVSI